MTHLLAEAVDDFNGEGTVWAHSERWRAHSRVPVRKGQQLRITKVDGLLLEVEPLPSNAPTGERS
jgi:membrane-bound serine protease (ClpP class)